MIKRYPVREILDQLDKEGGTKYHDTPEDIKAMVEFGERMQEVRREFKRKNLASEISSEYCIFNA